MPSHTHEADLNSLLARLAQQDEAAMAAFYDATSAKVYGLARHMLRDEAWAEEVAMDTYMQVWQEAGRYDSARASAWAWVLMIARSRALDKLRAMKNNALLDDLEDFADRLADAGAGPEEHALADERGRRVRACLAQLPPIERQKLALAFFRGLSQSEMADYCGMPLGTVKTHVRNGMARLGRLLEG